MLNQFCFAAVDAPFMGFEDVEQDILVFLRWCCAEASSAASPDVSRRPLPALVVGRR
jgi:hypothetical protein